MLPTLLLCAGIQRVVSNQKWMFPRQLPGELDACRLVGSTRGASITRGQLRLTQQIERQPMFYGGSAARRMPGSDLFQQVQGFGAASCVQQELGAITLRAQHLE